MKDEYDALDMIFDLFIGLWALGSSVAGLSAWWWGW